MATQTKLKGIVKWFNPRKGFGFITDPDGVDHFCHFSAVEKGRTYTGFEEGDEVEFNIVNDGERGTKCANVVLTSEEWPKKRKKQEKDNEEVVTEVTADIVENNE